MRLVKIQKLIYFSITQLTALILIAGLVNAQSSSPNYKIEESYFGIGGELEATSPNYSSRQSVGESGVGNTTSNNFQTQAGFNTTDAELLEVEVSGGTFELGVLSSSTTSSDSTSFTVRNYLSSGYVVRLGGQGLSENSGGHTLSSLSSPTASTPGTEQFGVNLVANSSPSVGADPLQIPDNSFSFGSAETDYDTADQFKHAEDDIIASSASSSGETEYTLSFIANIATNTPAGDYGASLFVVVIPTF
jgi:hypothetical protein